MILQRLIQNLAGQHFGKAMAEILIVVIGIFIGLQVDDWNQARKDRIDETLFLNSLHDDVLRAEELSRRLRTRRVQLLDSMLSAGDVLLQRGDRNSLTEKECNSIVWSTAFNITVPTLPSVDELTGTGRMNIIRNTELRTALVALRQTRAALDAAISEKTASSNFNFLPAAFPELFRMDVYFDQSLDEVQSRNQCDLAAMRANRSFLNLFSANTDGFDAYIRDGVRPWSLQFDRVHELVDRTLGINDRVAVVD